jgi:DNA repair exonuclease SbcCD ATPase subunit
MSNKLLRTASHDAEIAQEVARIRQEHPYQGHYREQMAALLNVMFFKFGEKPGANRLAALLAENGRSPSTSTAQDEINKFWNRIREQAAVKIDRPDVPQSLLDMFSEMAGKVWTSSMAEAATNFDAQRQELEAQLRVALGEAAALREQLSSARSATEEALRTGQAVMEQHDALIVKFAKEVASREAAEGRVAKLEGQLDAVRQEQAAESQRTQATLQEMRTALEQAAAEQRRLLVIGDDFKQQAARDRALRTKSEEAQAQLLAELTRLREQVTQLSGEKGVLEGRLSAQDQQLEQLRTAQDEQNKPGALPVRMKKLRSSLRTRVR